MRRISIFTLLVLGLVGGVASADRWRPQQQSSVRDHRGGWNQHSQSRSYVRYQPRTYRGQARVYSQPRVYSQARVRYVRHPIYVQRPVIRYRYYNYYQRPALIVENYSAMPGYTWVPGQWQWSGYEWIWQPGHYEPDASYDYNSYDTQPYNDDPAPSEYYDNGGY